MQAEQTPLGEILERFRRECRIQITGLEHREKDIISYFSQKNTPEEVLKQLFRVLGEGNYLLDHDDEGLRRVYVLGRAEPKVSQGSEQYADQKPKSKLLTVAMVQSVIEGTQAQFMNLMEGDLIISYDGIKIRSAPQLAQEVRKTNPEHQVEMIVLRDGDPIRFILDGGLIGVRVQTKQVSEEELPDFYRDKPSDGS